MTRWLAATKLASCVPDKTDKRDRTPPCAERAFASSSMFLPDSQGGTVLSVVSVLSEGATPDFRNGEDSKPSSPVIDHEALQMAFEERAAILEFDAGYSRDEAEKRARSEVFGDR